MPLLELGATDQRFLNRARALARNGWGGVHPNPLVGCVLVKNGEVVAEGWHEEFGGPHAETRALERAGPAAQGATAYVSLEPCRHEGKTPACTRALVASGVARVVYGAADPGAESGGGGAELAAAGVEVVGPVLDENEAWSENPAFFQWARTGRPHVAVKLALSLDGGLAAAPGERTPLTGDEAQVAVHELRSGFDAVLVGRVTAEVDDPRLSVRRVQRIRPAPIRIVLDSQAALSGDSALIREIEEAPVWVFCREDAREMEMERLEALGVDVHPVPAARPGPGVSLEAVLERCALTGVRSILCEGGGIIASRFLDAGLARRVYALVAPVVLGDDRVPAFPGTAAGTRWKQAGEPRRFGDDTLITLDRID